MTLRPRGFSRSPSRPEWTRGQRPGLPWPPRCPRPRPVWVAQVPSWSARSGRTRHRLLQLVRANPIQAASHTPPPPGLRQPQPGKAQGLRTGKGWEVVSVDVMFVITQRRVQRNVQHVECQGAEAIYLRGFGLIALEFLLSLDLGPSYILHSAVFF